MSSRFVVFLALVWCGQADNNLPYSCKDVYEGTTDPVSGVYPIYTVNGDIVEVFCDFYDGSGYTYVNKNDLCKLPSLHKLYTSRDHIMTRVLYSDGVQKAANFEPLSAYRHRYPLSFRLSEYTDFNGPKNHAMAPYIYVGLLPKEYAASRTEQGYRTAGIDNIFKNCDSNPNSYLALFSNLDDLAPNGYYKGACNGCNSPLMRRWIEKAQLVPQHRKMPADFYYFFEMHMGGCGGYIVTNSIENLVGAAVGFPFKV